MTSFRSHSTYKDNLKRIRNWLLNDNQLFRLWVPYTLKSLVGVLDDDLYSVLLEWVQSGENQKIESVINILRQFNSGPLFYHLCQEIVMYSRDDTNLGEIVAMIGSTPGVITGPMSNFTRSRLSEIMPWINDKSFKVRRFAKKLEQYLIQRYDDEINDEAFRQRSGLE